MQSQYLPNRYSQRSHDVYVASVYHDQALAQQSTSADAWGAPSNSGGTATCYCGSLDPLHVHDAVEGVQPIPHAALHYQLHTNLSHDVNALSCSPNKGELLEPHPAHVAEAEQVDDISAAHHPLPADYNHASNPLRGPSFDFWLEQKQREAIYQESQAKRAALAKLGQLLRRKAQAKLAYEEWTRRKEDEAVAERWRHENAASDVSPSPSASPRSLGSRSPARSPRTRSRSRSPRRGKVPSMMQGLSLEEQSQLRDSLFKEWLSEKMHANLAVATNRRAQQQLLRHAEQRRTEQAAKTAKALFKNWLKETSEDMKARKYEQLHTESKEQEEKAKSSQEKKVRSEEQYRQWKQVKDQMLKAQRQQKKREEQQKQLISADRKNLVASTRREHEQRLREHYYAIVGAASPQPAVSPVKGDRPVTSDSVIAAWPTAPFSQPPVDNTSTPSQQKQQQRQRMSFWRRKDPDQVAAYSLTKSAVKVFR